MRAIYIDLWRVSALLVALVILVLLTIFVMAKSILTLLNFVIQIKIPIP